jgi:hypothetical protein
MYITNKTVPFERERALVENLSMFSPFQVNLQCAADTL